MIIELCKSGIPVAAKYRLLQTVFYCHEQAARHNQNASNEMVGIAAVCSGDFTKSVIAGLSALGDAHGPITAARQAIYCFSAEDRKAKLYDGWKVPGWGNSFYKTSIDPAWERMEELVADFYPVEAQRLEAISAEIKQATNRTLYPNAAAFTAVAAEILGIPAGVEAVLFLIPRLPVWAEIYDQARKKGKNG